MWHQYNLKSLQFNDEAESGYEFYSCNYIDSQNADLWSNSSAIPHKTKTGMKFSVASISTNEQRSYFFLIKLFQIGDDIINLHMIVVRWKDFQSKYEYIRFMDSKSTKQWAGSTFATEISKTFINFLSRELKWYLPSNWNYHHQILLLLHENCT